MSGEIAKAFAVHYNDSGFDCSNVHDAMWLSWGNSWISSHCHWSAKLLHALNVTISIPIVNCGYFLQFHSPETYNISIDLTHRPHNFPCLDQPLIFHHWNAADVMLKREPDHAKHMCEYMLLVDKVKDTTQMNALWTLSANASQLHDFSPLFTHDGLEGWHQMFLNFADYQSACNSNASSTKCTSYRTRLRARARTLLVQERSRLQPPSLADEHYSPAMRHLLLAWSSLVQELEGYRGKPSTPFHSNFTAENKTISSWLLE